MDFFLHGSMSTEVIPEAVLRAFIKTYPDLFPTGDLSHLGLLPDSRVRVADRIQPGKSKTSWRVIRGRN